MSDKYAALTEKCELIISQMKASHKDVAIYAPIMTWAEFESLLAERDADKKRIAELESENEYVRKRFKEVDLLFGKNLLVMKAAIIEWQSTGEAKTGLSWIFNTLLGPGELPSEEEKGAQAYFDREYAPMDEELMALHKWFWERNDRIKAERAAAGISLKIEGE